METKLARIAEIARTRPQEKFTSLAHLINEDMLVRCNAEMSANKATGVDGVTKKAYEEELRGNIASLLQRMKTQAYKPQPVRRTYIPKPGTDKLRPLGIPAYEDKLVQMAVTKILTAIYEPAFHPCSFGFRPRRGCHDAIKALEANMKWQPTNYVVDADIRGFFDHLKHEWLMKFLEHRITDPNFLRIIARFLKAGVMEAGITQETTEGAPQGGVVSPMLANIYLHYVLDLWFYKAIKPSCKGAAYMVRYADDYVACFKYEEDATNYYQALIERMNRFGLELAEDKTKIILFGKQEWNQHKQRGQGKPETFDFLGFTHYCSQSQKGFFRVKRKTSRKKFRASLTRIKEWVRDNRTMQTVEIIENLQKKLAGHYQYFGITDNIAMLSKYRYEVERILFKWLNRRSQKKSYTWQRFAKLLAFFPLPKPKIYVDIFQLRTDILYFL